MKSVAKRSMYVRTDNPISPFFLSLCFHKACGILSVKAMSKEQLLDESLLEGLTEEEKAEALEAAAAAKRAEERAEQRALERAIEERRLERQRQQEKIDALSRKSNSQLTQLKNGSSEEKIVFIPKRKRGELKSFVKDESATTNKTMNAKGKDPMTFQDKINHNQNGNGNGSNQSNHDFNQNNNGLSKEELASIKKTYLGESALDSEEAIHRKRAEDQKRARQNKKKTFKFEWDNSEDTSADAFSIVSSDLKPLSFVQRHKKTKLDRFDEEFNRNTVSSNVLTKPIENMTARDWRIIRENYDITVRGGKTPPPLRTFRESVPPIHPALIHAIESVLRYKEPSPIQRQAIPIGLQRRDLIGIAETGSGKTAAFGIPLCHLILSLPDIVLSSVVENGPLALVMAPTRELAIQIDIEFKKLLSRQDNIKTACVIGGQQIEKQAMELRNGVHVVVGTPGRINDCIESAYLVLNQCSYIVLDEADRMIDLGFTPQIETILDAMGGYLKSENEKEAYEQEIEDLENIPNHVPKYRLTAMFSATMSPEVQRIARKYLRHPAIVSIGESDGGGKNKRIDQRVVFLSSPSMKEKALKDVILGRTTVSDKVIVFVNEKKHTDEVARMIERMGRRTVVLHGGKTQDQREENLAAFRRGGVILVATDVAGRGLDIPNVKHVINYDLPTRSIDNYCHRIGRTARAGMDGFATSFITDEDEGIMAPLKSYLESVGATVPDRLARHPAASSSTVGGNII